MRRFRFGILARALAVPIGVIVGFFLLEHPMRVVETATVAETLRLLGARAEIPLIDGTQMLVEPHGHAAFWVIVLPSCSSLGPILALVALSTFLRRRPGGYPVPLAVGVACLSVFAGNLVRIGSSVAVGLFAGRASLVLFHNWVGSVFGFGYVLFGFVAMLWLVLPRRERSPGGAGLADGTDGGFGHDRDPALAGAV
jgi:exosortase/archaeosortase family protein